MPKKTGVPWLDDIVIEANIPLRLDRESAAIVISKLLSEAVSTNTLRRWPVRYRLEGGRVRYRVEDLVEFVRKRIDAPPLRTPAPRRGPTLAA
jgi:hypothetical protein